MLPQPSSARKSSPIVGRGAASTMEKGTVLPNISQSYLLVDAAVDATNRPVGKQNRGKTIPDFKVVDVRQIIEKDESTPDSIQVTIQLGGPGESGLLPEEQVDQERLHPASEASVRKFNSPPKVLPRASVDTPLFKEPAQTLDNQTQASKVSPSFSSSQPISLVDIFRPKQRFILVVAAAAMALLFIGFLVGTLSSGSQSQEEKSASFKPSQLLLQELNNALSFVDSGDPSEALRKIQALSAKHPDVSSLDYLAALAAMQSGDFKTAQEKASLSIQKNQKVSDSLVLLSMTESLGGAGEGSSLRDPKLVRESLLREAVDSDVANPFPMIELASFLRTQKRDDEALEFLKAADVRLHPVDTHVVVATSIQLMQLEQTPDDKLPTVANEGSIPEIFASIYISLRKKDYKQAAIALEKGRHQASPDLFAYLINDPVFKPFQAEPVMTLAL